MLEPTHRLEYLGLILETAQASDFKEIIVYLFPDYDSSVQICSEPSLLHPSHGADGRPLRDNPVWPAWHNEQSIWEIICTQKTRLQLVGKRNSDLIMA